VGCYGGKANIGPQLLNYYWVYQLYYWVYQLFIIGPQLLRWFINFIIGFSKNHITSAHLDGAVPLHMRSTLLGSIDLRMTNPVACGAEAMLF
jgi:hypothetical protein